jgi:hypothetical protein
MKLPGAHTREVLLGSKRPTIRKDRLRFDHRPSAAADWLDDMDAVSILPQVAELGRSQERNAKRIQAFSKRISKQGSRLSQVSQNLTPKPPNRPRARRPTSQRARVTVEDVKVARRNLPALTVPPLESNVSALEML